MATTTKTFKVTVDTSEATDSVKKTTKSVKDLSKETKKTSGEMKGGFKGASDSAQKLGSSMGGATGAAVTFATGIKSMTKAAIAFIATPLGLLLTGIALAIAAVKTAFTSSEEGQNKYAKLMSVIGVVVGNLMDIVAEFGEAIIGVFENPQKAVEDFAKSIKENITNRFEGLIELVPALGEAISLVFKGKWKEAGKVAVDATAKITSGVENVTDKIGKAGEAMADFAEQTAKEMAQAADVADMRAKADIIERDLLVERAKTEGEIAELRLRARQEDQFGAEERRAAIVRATELQDGLLQKETEVLELRADAQIAENTFSKSNKENLDKEAEAVAKVHRQQAVRLNQARTMQRELNTINTQLAAEENARINELEKARKIAHDKHVKRIKEEADLEFDLADKTATKKIETLKALQDANLELMAEGEEKELEAARIALERRLEGIMGANALEIELRDALEAAGLIEKQAIIDKFAAEELGKQKDSNKKLLDEEKNLANARQSVAQSLGSVLGSIASLISQQSKEGVIAAKVLAIAQIAIDTAVAITGAIAQAQSVPYPGNLAAIATGVAAVVAGIASAVTTLNTANVPGGNAPPPSPPPAVTAPSFAGVSTNTTELGNTESAELAPIQAFVVETQLTGSQNEVNQIEGQAEFGGLPE